MRRFILISASLALLAGTDAFAQKFNPRVEVTNTFEGKVLEAHKQDLQMNVPDSLTKFQYNIDYSVFDKPYQGSYEFQPYKIEMKPEAAPSGQRHLYANIGAGYTFHPVGDVVFSPSFKKIPLKLSVYDTFRGFLGHYGIQESNIGSASSLVVFENRNDHVSNGFVFDNKAGVDARYEFANLALEADMGYRFLSANDTLNMHNLHMAECMVRLLPLDPTRADYFYGGKLYVNAGKDDIQSLLIKRHKMGVNDMGADFTAGKNLTPRSVVQAEAGIETVIYSGYRDATATKVWIAPRYIHEWDRGYAKLGVKISYLKGSDTSAEKPTPDCFQHKSNIIYPDIYVNHFLVKDYLSVYASATGGDSLNDFASVLRENPFIDPTKVIPYMDSSSETVNAKAGFKGTIAGRLSYDIGGGYSILSNARCDAFGVYYNQNAHSYYYAPYYNFCDYDIWHVGMSLLWKSPRVDVDGHLRYQKTDLMDNYYYAVAPAEVVWGIDATYNWNRRIFAGLVINAESSREGFFHVEGIDFRRVSLPAFVDLGIKGSYKFNDRWTAWLKAGNLLGHAVRTYFMHPEAGQYVTVGASFNI